MPFQTNPSTTSTYKFLLLLLPSLPSVRDNPAKERKHPSASATATPKRYLLYLLTLCLERYSQPLLFLKRDTTPHMCSFAHITNTTLFPNTQNTEVFPAAGWLLPLWGAGSEMCLERKQPRLLSLISCHLHLPQGICGIHLPTNLLIFI